MYSNIFIVLSLETTDDGGADNLKYKWELIAGPLQGVSDPDDGWEKPLLKLADLSVGKYQFV